MPAGPLPLGLYERQAKSQKKHPCSTSSSGAFRPLAAPRQNVGWKGPAYLHKKPKTNRPPPPSLSSIPVSTVQDNVLPRELQQLVLNIYRSAFPAASDFEALKPVLMEVKRAVDGRDWEGAFGGEEGREGFAVRWSPWRSLGVANLLAWVVEGVAVDEVWTKGLLERRGEGAEAGKGLGRPAKVVCFGGGAAEIMGFAALLRYLRPDACGQSSAMASSGEDGLEEDVSKLAITDAQGITQPMLNLHLVDMANWLSVIDKLERGIVTAPILSKYASTSAKASNASFLAPQIVKCTFTQTNVLETSLSSLKTIIGPSPALITLFFTLNELYSASIPKTTKFLLELTLAAPKGSLLLVVDSPGSYPETAMNSKRASSSHEEENESTDGRSETGENESKKRYPMHWLMDAVLLEKGKKREEDDKSLPLWEKLVEEESRSYQLAEGLKFPISMENMRFQVHLFRRQ